MKYRKKPVLVETVEPITRSTKHGEYFRYQTVIRALGFNIILSHSDYIINQNKK